MIFINRKRQKHVYNPDDGGDHDTNVNLQTSSSPPNPHIGGKIPILKSQKNPKNSKKIETLSAKPRSLLLGSKWRNPVRIPDPTQSRPLQSTSHPSPPSLLLPPLVSTSLVVVPSRCNHLVTPLSRAFSTIPPARRDQSAETKP